MTAQLSTASAEPSTNTLHLVYERTRASACAGAQLLY
eukprot:CAMPEP_0174864752 /NCGR_PEP_ID=MMETSP1114-20130205/59089_1 /TAXON_ID=312471 /ORGANISM="Neobodo designis, Strain CCAP 1951/1" /LENGTH=36 /DNA_ID= /DNA_START= /DNA_END= /DNA_ORIENTATION=